MARIPSQEPRPVPEEDTAMGRSGRTKPISDTSQQAAPSQAPPRRPSQSRQPSTGAKRPVRRRRLRAADSGWYLPCWSLAVMVGVVGIAAFVTLYVVMQLGASTPASNPPVVREVTSTPSLNRDFDLGGAANDANPGPVLSPVAPPAGQSLPTLALSPTPPPANFTVGIQVEVIAAGLNVRTEPGLQGEVEQIVYEGQVLALVDGPQNVNNLEWWLVQIPDEPAPLGWAARTDQNGQPLMGIYYGE